MRIGILGGGNLGKAVSNLLTNNLKNGSVLISNSPNSNNLLIEHSDILFLCVKPNNVTDILKVVNQNGEDKMIVSCAAGISMEYMENRLKKQHQIIRCMPNLPITFRKGSIIYLQNQRVEKSFLNNFLELTRGPHIKEVENDNLIDISTVLTGCMPGFTSFLAKEFIEFGSKNGFTYEESRDLYISTVEGTMEMLKTQTVEEIIEQVSSPKGATAQGISYLENSTIKNILFSAQYNSLKTVLNLKKQ